MWIRQDRKTFRNIPIERAYKVEFGTEAGEVKIEIDGEKPRVYFCAPEEAALLRSWLETQILNILSTT